MTNISHDVTTFLTSILTPWDIRLITLLSSHNTFSRFKEVGLRRLRHKIWKTVVLTFKHCHTVNLRATVIKFVFTKSIERSNTFQKYWPEHTWMDSKIHSKTDDLVNKLNSKRTVKYIRYLKWMKKFQLSKLTWV